MKKNDLGQRLLNLKNNLDDAKSRRSELQGQLKGLIKQLKDEFELDSLDAAQTKIKELNTQLNHLQDKLNTELTAAEEAFSNDTV